MSLTIATPSTRYGADVKSSTSECPPLGISRNSLVRSEIRDRRLTQLKAMRQRYRAEMPEYYHTRHRAGMEMTVSPRPSSFIQSFLTTHFDFATLLSLVVAPVLLSCPLGGLVDHVLPARLRKSRSVWILITSSSPPMPLFRCGW